MPSSLSLIISCFWFKVRDMQVLLSLELRGHCRIINWSNFNIAVSQGTGRPKKWERDRGLAGEWSSQNTHIWFALLCVCGSWHPKTITTVTSMITITDHYHKDNNNEKIWNIARITKIWHRGTSEQMLLGKMAPTDLAWGRVATNLQSVKNTVSVKCNKAKCNKMRYACKFALFFFFIFFFIFYFFCIVFKSLSLWSFVRAAV